MQNTSFIKRLNFLWIFIAIIWAIFLLGHFLPLNNFGLIPRTSKGLIGIISAPFLHGSLFHIISNTIGLLIFGIVFIFIEGKKMISVLLEIILVQGILTWIFARTAIHIGASGIIFGLYAYLIFLGYFTKKIKYIVVSLLIIIFYGGMIFGILPGIPGISWEGHLFGFIAGILEAKFRN